MKRIELLLSKLKEIESKLTYRTLSSKSSKSASSVDSTAFSYKNYTH